MNRRRTIGRLITRAGAILVLAVLAPIATSLYSAWVFHGSAASAGAAVEVLSALEPISTDASEREKAAAIARIDAMVEKLAAYPASASLPVEPDEYAVAAKKAAIGLLEMWQGMRASDGIPADAILTAEDLRSLRKAATIAAATLTEAGRVEAEGLRRRLVFVTVFSLGVVALVTIASTVRVASPLGRLAEAAQAGHDESAPAPGPYAATEIAIAAERLEMTARRYLDADDQRQGILNSLPMAVFEVDGSGRVRYFNSSGARLAASAGLSLHGLAFTDLLDEGSHSAFMDLLKGAAETPNAVPLDLDRGGHRALVLVRPLSGAESKAKRWAVWCDTRPMAVALQTA